MHMSNVCYCPIKAEMEWEISTVQIIEARWIVQGHSTISSEFFIRSGVVDPSSPAHRHKEEFWLWDCEGTISVNDGNGTFSLSSNHFSHVCLCEPWRAVLPFNYFWFLESVVYPAPTLWMIFDISHKISVLGRRITFAHSLSLSYLTTFVLSLHWVKKPVSRL